MNNLEVAELLRDVAASYQLKDQNKYRFQIIAYQRAADAVEHATSELKDLWDDGKLEEVPGIGPSISQHLDELFKTGRSKHFESLMRDLPPQMFELMKVPGIGPKTAYKLVTNLGIGSLDELIDAAKTGKIAEIEGFGNKSQEEILKSIEETKTRSKTKRFLLPYAEDVAQKILNWIKRDPHVVQADPLGSLRRKVSTVGDLDFSTASTNLDKTLEHFTKYPNLSRILEKGEAKAAILLPSGIQVDLLVTDPVSYGALLQHFTGSKHHNIALREYAKSLSPSLSLSEHGIKKEGKLYKFSNEEDFYKTLGMAWIPPELREDTGEIEAALCLAQGTSDGLPNLVENGDVKGDLQIHSSFDIETSHDLGASSMEEVIEGAGKLGYEYLAFTEHNPSRSKHTEIQIVNILKRKREKVVQLNYSGMKHMKYRVKKVFNSLEIDIMPDGKLPVSNEGLETLDFALVSIHSTFKLPREKMTNRVLAALSQPKVKIFAHPTARKLNDREGVELDWNQIFDFCLKNKKWLEINSDPSRLDLPDTLVREAVKKGVLLTLGTDAHHTDGLKNMPYGVSVARRGWATKKDIVNTKSLADFEEVLE
ncbi:hypothetical protein HY045_02070 [Candidatus Woesebacteria bacterium]|nr:hypothetical protein [Candidatus Woesebacteria bacterium]